MGKDKRTTSKQRTETSARQASRNTLDRHGVRTSTSDGVVEVGVEVDMAPACVRQRGRTRRKPDSVQVRTSTSENNVQVSIVDLRQGHKQKISHGESRLSKRREKGDGEFRVRRSDSLNKQKTRQECKEYETQEFNRSVYQLRRNRKKSKTLEKKEPNEKNINMENHVNTSGNPVSEEHGVGIISFFKNIVTFLSPAPPRRRRFTSRNDFQKSGNNMNQKTQEKSSVSNNQDVDPCENLNENQRKVESRRSCSARKFHFAKECKARAQSSGHEKTKCVSRSLVRQTKSQVGKREITVAAEIRQRKKLKELEKEKHSRTELKSSSSNNNEKARPQSKEMVSKQSEDKNRRSRKSSASKTSEQQSQKNPSGTKLARKTHRKQSTSETFRMQSPKKTAGEKPHLQNSRKTSPSKTSKKHSLSKHIEKESVFRKIGKNSTRKSYKEPLFNKKTDTKSRSKTYDKLAVSKSSRMKSSSKRTEEVELSEKNIAEKMSRLSTQKRDKTKTRSKMEAVESRERKVKSIDLLRRKVSHEIKSQGKSDSCVCEAQRSKSTPKEISKRNELKHEEQDDKQAKLPESKHLIDLCPIIIFKHRSTSEKQINKVKSPKEIKSRRPKSTESKSAIEKESQKSLESTGTSKSIAQTSQVDDVPRSKPDKKISANLRDKKKRKEFQLNPGLFQEIREEAKRLGVVLGSKVDELLKDLEHSSIKKKNRASKLQLKAGDNLSLQSERSRSTNMTESPSLNDNKCPCPLARSSSVFSKVSSKKSKEEIDLLDGSGKRSQQGSKTLIESKSSSINTKRQRISCKIREQFKALGSELLDVFISDPRLLSNLNALSDAIRTGEQYKGLKPGEIPPIETKSLRNSSLKDNNTSKSIQQVAQTESNPNEKVESRETLDNSERNAPIKTKNLIDARKKEDTIIESVHEVAKDNHLEKQVHTVFQCQLSNAYRFESLHETTANSEKGKEGINDEEAGLESQCADLEQRSKHTSNDHIAPKTVSVLLQEPSFFDTAVQCDICSINVSSYQKNSSNPLSRKQGRHNNMWKKQEKSRGMGRSARTREMRSKRKHKNEIAPCQNCENNFFRVVRDFNNQIPSPTFTAASNSVSIRRSSKRFDESYRRQNDDIPIVDTAWRSPLKNNRTPQLYDKAENYRKPVAYDDEADNSSSSSQISSRSCAPVLYMQKEQMSSCLVISPKNPPSKSFTSFSDSYFYKSESENFDTDTMQSAYQNYAKQSQAIVKRNSFPSRTASSRMFTDSRELHDISMSSTKYKESSFLLLPQKRGKREKKDRKYMFEESNNLKTLQYSCHNEPQTIDPSPYQLPPTQAHPSWTHNVTYDILETESAHKPTIKKQISNNGPVKNNDKTHLDIGSELEMGSVSYQTCHKVEEKSCIIDDKRRPSTSENYQHNDRESLRAVGVTCEETNSFINVAKSKSQNSMEIGYCNSQDSCYTLNNAVEEESLKIMNSTQAIPKSILHRTERSRYNGLVVPVMQCFVTNKGNAFRNDAKRAITTVNNPKSNKPLHKSINNEPTAENAINVENNEWDGIKSIKNRRIPLKVINRANDVFERIKSRRKVNPRQSVMLFNFIVEKLLETDSEQLETIQEKGKSRLKNLLHRSTVNDPKNIELREIRQKKTLSLKQKHEPNNFVPLTKELLPTKSLRQKVIDHQNVKSKCDPKGEFSKLKTCQQAINIEKVKSIRSPLEHYQASQQVVELYKQDKTKHNGRNKKPDEPLDYHKYGSPTSSDISGQQIKIDVSEIDYLTSAAEFLKQQKHSQASPSVPFRRPNTRSIPFFQPKTQKNTIKDKVPRNLKSLAPKNVINYINANVKLRVPKVGHKTVSRHILPCPKLIGKVERRESRRRINDKPKASPPKGLLQASERNNTRGQLASQKDRSEHYKIQGKTVIKIPRKRSAENHAGAAQQRNDTMLGSHRPNALSQFYTRDKATLKSPLPRQNSPVRKSPRRVQSPQISDVKRASSPKRGINASPGNQKDRISTQRPSFVSQRKQVSDRNSEVPLDLSVYGSSNMEKMSNKTSLTLTEPEIHTNLNSTDIMEFNEPSFSENSEKTKQKSTKKNTPLSKINGNKHSIMDDKYEIISATSDTCEQYNQTTNSNTLSDSFHKLTDFHGTNAKQFNLNDGTPNFEKFYSKRSTSPQMIKKKQGSVLQPNTNSLGKTARQYLSGIQNFAGHNPTRALGALKNLAENKRTTRQPFKTLRIPRSKYITQYTDRRSVETHIKDQRNTTATNVDQKISHSRRSKNFNVNYVLNNQNAMNTPRIEDKRKKQTSDLNSYKENEIRGGNPSSSIPDLKQNSTISHLSQEPTFKKKMLVDYPNKKTQIEFEKFQTSVKSSTNRTIGRQRIPNTASPYKINKLKAETISNSPLYTTHKTESSSVGHTVQHQTKSRPAFVTVVRPSAAVPPRKFASNNKPARKWARNNANGLSNATIESTESYGDKKSNTTPRTTQDENSSNEIFQKDHWKHEAEAKQIWWEKHGKKFETTIRSSGSEQHMDQRIANSKNKREDDEIEKKCKRQRNDGYEFPIDLNPQPTFIVASNQDHAIINQQPHQSCTDCQLERNKPQAKSSLRANQSLIQEEIQSIKDKYQLPKTRNKNSFQQSHEDIVKKKKEHSLQVMTIAERNREAALRSGRRWRQRSPTALQSKSTHPEDKKTRITVTIAERKKQMGKPKEFDIRLGYESERTNITNETTSPSRPRIEVVVSRENAKSKSNFKAVSPKSIENKQPNDDRQNPLKSSQCHQESHSQNMKGNVSELEKTSNKQVSRILGEQRERTLDIQHDAGNHGTKNTLPVSSRESFSDNSDEESLFSWSGSVDSQQSINKDIVNQVADFSERPLSNLNIKYSNETSSLKPVSSSGEVVPSMTLMTPSSEDLLAHAVGSRKFPGSSRSLVKGLYKTVQIPHGPNPERLYRMPTIPSEGASEDGCDLDTELQITSRTLDQVPLTVETQTTRSDLHPTTNIPQKISKDNYNNCESHGFHCVSQSIESRLETPSVTVNQLRKFFERSKASVDQLEHIILDAEQKQSSQIFRADKSHTRTNVNERNSTLEGHSKRGSLRSSNDPAKYENKNVKVLKAPSNVSDSESSFSSTCLCGSCSRRRALLNCECEDCEEKKTAFQDKKAGGHRKEAQDKKHAVLPEKLDEKTKMEIIPNPDNDKFLKMMYKNESFLQTRSEEGMDPDNEKNQQNMNQHFDAYENVASGSVKNQKSKNFIGDSMKEVLVAVNQKSLKQESNHPHNADLARNQLPSKKSSKPSNPPQEMSTVNQCQAVSFQTDKNQIFFSRVSETSEETSRSGIQVRDSTENRVTETSTENTATDETFQENPKRISDIITKPSKENNNRSEFTNSVQPLTKTNNIDESYSSFLSTEVSGTLKSFTTESSMDNKSNDKQSSQTSWSSSQESRTIVPTVPSLHDSLSSSTRDDEASKTSSSTSQSCEKAPVPTAPSAHSDQHSNSSSSCDSSSKDGRLSNILKEACISCSSTSTENWPEQSRSQAQGQDLSVSSVSNKAVVFHYTPSTSSVFNVGPQTPLPTTLPSLTELPVLINSDEEPTPRASFVDLTPSEKEIDEAKKKAYWDAWMKAEDEKNEIRERAYRKEDERRAKFQRSSMNARDTHQIRGKKDKRVPDYGDMSGDDDRSPSKDRINNPTVASSVASSRTRKEKKKPCNESENTIKPSPLANSKTSRSKLFNQVGKWFGRNLDKV